MAEEIVVEVHPFFCPIDPATHPDEDLVAQRSGEWASAVGLVADEAELRRWLSSTSADFYGGMVPHADTDGYQLATDWVYWGFYFDDAHCDQGTNLTSPHRVVPVAARLLRMLDSGDERLCAGNRYLLGLCDLARRYQKFATPTQYDRWVTAQRRWLFGVVQQTTRRAAGMVPTLDDYLLTRLHEAGGPPTQSMFEVANRAEIPGSEMDSPPVRAITEAFWMIASLDNDLVSRHREVLEQQDRYNAVDIIARELSLPEEAATVELVRLRDRIMLLFLALRNQLAATASLPLRTYLDTLGHGIRANIDWSLRTPRYEWLRPKDGPSGAEVRLRYRGTCTDTPSDARLAAPPLASVAWWWSQLSR
jgi:hypothetical protein